MNCDTHLLCILQSSHYPNASHVVKKVMNPNYC